MSGELVIWENALSKQPPDAIEWAFTEHLKAGQYFPKPAEIVGWIGQWHTQRRDSKQQQQIEDARRTRERLRAEGQPAGEEQLAETIKRLVEVAKKFPEPPSPMRRVELKERIARAQAERKQARGGGEGGDSRGTATENRVVRNSGPRFNAGGDSSQARA